MSETQTAIVAGGCFWCTEAVFNDVIGVTGVESGLHRRHGGESDLQAGNTRRHWALRSS